MGSTSKPKETLSTFDAVIIIVGVVVGVGIFKTPSIVASNASSEAMLILFWLLGGLASFIGALCYAELASNYPHAGGDYYYLSKAFGKGFSFLYAWARIVVIQTGSIAMVAFLIGDYASEIFNLGSYSSSIYAALTIILLTMVNIAGIRQGKWMQKVFVIVVITGLVIVAFTGFFIIGPQETTNAEKIIPRKVALGTAMIFVLLTYGGWNEASFLSAEIRSKQRNMIRVLLYSVAVITIIYLIINIALISSLGLSGMASSNAVMADLIREAFGEKGARFISLLILLAALSTVNATIITGARTSYAWGNDYPLLSFLGQWKEDRNTPANALIIQGVIALLLIFLGTSTRDGFVMMVEYTAPVFWLFLLMVGISIFILRHKNPCMIRFYNVPFYPFTPFLFCVICLFMLYSSLIYTSIGSIIGVFVLLVGIIPMLLQRKRSKSSD